MTVLSYGVDHNETTLSLIRAVLGAGDIILPPRAFSRQVKNDVRYRRETFSTLFDINVMSLTKISEKNQPIFFFLENGILVTLCFCYFTLKKAANVWGLLECTCLK